MNFQTSEVEMNLGGWVAKYDTRVEGSSSIPRPAQGEGGMGIIAHGLSDKHTRLWLIRFYPNPYGLRGIEGVSIPNKSKSPPIHINPLPSIWIENNRTSP
jgi:hypothetical protein